MKTCKLTALALLTTLLTACAEPIQTWHKKGVSPDAMRTTFAQCKYDVGMNKVSNEKEIELISDCMNAKGFRWKTIYR